MIAALSLFGVMLAQQGVGSTDTLRLTIAEARQRAGAAAPAVRMAAAEIAAASASLRAAGTIAANPSASFSWPAAIAGGGERFESQFTQPLDVTATRSLRKSVGSSALTRARLMEQDARRVAERDASIAFSEMFASVRRAAIAAEVAANLDRLVEAARARLEAGEISRLEADMVAIAAARARPALVEHRLAMRRAESRLAALLGLSPGTVISPVDPGGDVAASHATAGCRPDLMAMSELVRENRLRSRLARAEALPIPALAVVHEREPGTSGWWGIGFEVALPLWSSGGAAAAVHASDAERSTIAAAAASREAEADRRMLRERTSSTSEALELLRAAAVDLAEGSSARLLEGYRSGEIDLVDMLRLRDELDQVRFDYWNAWEAHQSALAELMAAGTAAEGCNDGF